MVWTASDFERILEAMNVNKVDRTRIISWVHNHKLILVSEGDWNRRSNLWEALKMVADEVHNEREHHD